MCGFVADWQGATTRQAGPAKEDQRGFAATAATKPCNRARSGLAQMVSMIEGNKVSLHATSRGLSVAATFFGPAGGPTWSEVFLSTLIHAYPPSPYLPTFKPDQAGAELRIR